ncbi:hypothetical protein [Parafrankia elaeagni]|uniref:hypothetical protein n=1 Tax=Parafrankia elaeagni TaxID=222534 RepID=UPI000381D628|nr:hypothetical protein [Parafrankia elaeagni]
MVRQRRALELDEELILASDRRRSPLTVGVLAETDAAVHTARLRGALYRSLRNHPIARARIAGGFGTATGWDFPAESGMPPDLIHEIQAGPQDEEGMDPAIWRALESLCSRPFNLRSEPPVRLLLAHRPTGDAIGLVAHHAALDGVSVLALLQEIIAGCAVDSRLPAATVRGSGKGADPSADGAVGPASPASPAGAGRGTRAGSEAAPRPRAARRWTMRHLVPCGPSLAQGYGIHPMDLPVPGPVTLADGRRMTVNDLLLAAAHLAAERWNTEHGRRSRTLRVRMPLAPASEGSRASGDLGNRSGQVMITSTAAERAAAPLLSGAVVDQTRAAKQRPTGWAGAGMTVAVRTATAAVPRSLRTAVLHCAVTAARPFLTPSLAVSNIGRVDVDAVPEPDRPRISGLSFVGTSGMPQGLIICVAGNGDRLRLTFCHHRHLFDPAGVARFAQIYRESLALITEEARS